MITTVAGTLVELDSTFTDAANNLVDPTVVTAEIRTPDGSVVQLATVRVSLGLWKATYTPLIPGRYDYRFQGTGAVAAAGEGSIVATTSFP